MKNNFITELGLDSSIIEELPLNYNFAVCPSLDLYNKKEKNINYRNVTIDIERYKAKNYLPIIFYKPMSKILTITDFSKDEY